VDIHSEPDRRLEIIEGSLLKIGRLLLANGAATEEVHRTVARLADAFGCEARLIITYEALLLTLIQDGRFRTKTGDHLPGMAVNLGVIHALNRIVDQAMDGRLPPAAMSDRLAKIDREVPAYPGPLVAIGLGLTAACLAKLFGGDWTAFALSFLAGAGGTLVRQQLGYHRFNPFLAAFVVAFVGGFIGAIGTRLVTTMTPALCLVAPGMIVVPGVPLINGVRDIVQNHVSIGLARIATSSIIVVVIALGLFSATIATGVDIPVNERAALQPVLADAAFSALAAVGFALLFNVPMRLAWVCAVCGLVSHPLRTALLNAGLDIVPATLLAAVAGGMLSHWLARIFRAPAATFVFPAVLAMIPGSYGFRAAIGCLQILQAGAAASPPLVAETLSLTVATSLLTMAIAIGVVLPLSLTKARQDPSRR
jgi:uncharacterized membrane protein YjjP (DUF1212 family)